MNKEIEITNLQVKGLMISSIIGTGILALPNSLAKIMGKDGWLALIIMGSMMMVHTIIINQIFKKNPGKDYFQIGRENLGNILFTIYLIILAGFLIAGSAIIIRTIGELTKSFLLQKTPLSIIVGTMILSVSYIAIYEIDALARMGYMIYTITLGAIILLILMALPTVKISNLLPVFQSDLSKIPKGLLESLFAFTGFEVLLFCLPYVKDKENSTRSSIMAILIVSLTYVALFLLVMTQFSIQQIRRQNYPVLMVAKAIDLPGFFIQNLDVIYMAIWTMFGFGTVAPAYYGSRKFIENIFNIRKGKYIVLILVPIIYVISMAPENILQVQEILGLAFNVLSIISVIVGPIIIYIVGSIRRWA